MANKIIGNKNKLKNLAKLRLPRKKFHARDQQKKLILRPIGLPLPQNNHKPTVAIFLKIHSLATVFLRFCWSIGYCNRHTTEILQSLIILIGTAATENKRDSTIGHFFNNATAKPPQFNHR